MWRREKGMVPFQDVVIGLASRITPVAVIGAGGEEIRAGRDQTLVAASEDGAGVNACLCSYA